MLYPALWAQLIRVWQLYTLQVTIASFYEGPSAVWSALCIAGRRDASSTLIASNAARLAAWAAFSIGERTPRSLYRDSAS